MNIEKNSATKATRSLQSPQWQQIDTFQPGNESIYQDWNDLIKRAAFQTRIFSMETAKHILTVPVPVNNRVMCWIYVEGVFRLQLGMNTF